MKNSPGIQTFNNTWKKIGLLAGPLAFLIIFFMVFPAGMNPQSRAVLACTVWIAIWWITEAIPIPVTSLMPIIIFPLTDALEADETAAAYGDSMIFLFLGGFIIAIAMEKWKLHKRIALNIIAVVGTSSQKIILGFMLATAFLSMWISNTATAMMMLPIGTAVILQLSDFINKKGLRDSNPTNSFGKVLMLAIAYSASIGGMATLVGTPPNVVLSGIINRTFNSQISFVQWLLFGIPVSIILLAVCWLYLTRIAFPLDKYDVSMSKNHIERAKASLGEISPEEKRVLMVFIIVAIAWISRPALINQVLPTVDDAMIAMGGAAALFIIPAATKGPLLKWSDAQKIPWGVILLFGGGLAVATAFKISGLSAWIGGQMNLLNNVDLWIIMATVATMVNFLTEVTSNTATSSMILPLLASISEAIQVHPFGLMIIASLASSCAFMLPVATPPNAIVFGSGYLSMRDMVKAGIWMNIFSIIVIVLAVYYILPLLWNIELGGFPENFR